jgi:putative aldouronate transport system substrate-binding protein
MPRKSYSLICLVLALSLLLGACQPAAPQAEAVKPAVEQLPPVTLTWFLDGPAPADEVEIENALNNLPQMQGLNAKLDLVFYDWGAFDQKMSLMFSGGEECDLVFTASWANNYINNALNGNLIELDAMLPELAPKVWEGVSDTAWNMSRVHGKIYAIPNQQLWYQAWGVVIEKSIADKYNIDLSKVNRVEDLNPYMAQVFEGEPQLNRKVVGTNGTMVQSLYWGYDPVASVGVIKLGDSSRKIINYIETPEYRQFTELMRDWHVKGYTPNEPTDMGNHDNARKQKVYPFKFHVAKPGVNAEEKAMTGHDQIYKSLQPPVLSYVTPTMTGICATSKNPERALKVFELFYTDEVVYNTLAKGIEGKHWVWVDKAKKVIGMPEGVDVDNNTWNLNRDWMFGNNFLAYYVNPDQVGAWEETQLMNQKAIMPMPGPFVFDPSEVTAEITAVEAVGAEFFDVLAWGLIDPDDPNKGVTAYIAALQKAGVNKVIDEMQRQLDAFVQDNPEIFK